MPPPSPGAPAQLFYSYSHKDEKLRDQLETHLSTLKRENRISGWHDRRITAGTEWKGEIDEHLKSSSVILLLVTANFLASDYCHDVELRYAMDQHEQGKARVIPVILRPCDWKTTIFAKLQALPTDGKPVIDWKTRDNAFLNVVEGIRKVLDELGHGGSSPTIEKTPAIPAIPIPILNALHQLPTPPADFTGRKDELKELLQAVKVGGVTISGMHGLGGVGKTALALKLAEQLKPDYPDAQFYLDLKGVSTQPLTPRDAMAYIVRAYHPTVQLPEKEEELAPLYRSILDGKRALLLMDNARDAQQVAPLIPPAGCLLLVTSRQHFSLPGLVEKNLDKLSRADARELLLRIAPRLKKEKTEQVDELVRLCGYLPLALRAVASALHEKKNIGPVEYANRLRKTGENLVLKEIDPSLQKSVGAALQSSYELLSDELRQKFRTLSVFPGTFNQEAASAVWKLPLESAQDLLSELLAYSIVDFDETAKRYGLHDLVRLFAKQLLNTEERRVEEKNHARYYLQVMSAACALYEKGHESTVQGLTLFDAEWTNIQAGQAMASAGQQDDDELAEMCWSYQQIGFECLCLRKHPHEQIRWLKPALSSSQRLKKRGREGRVLGNLGIAYNQLGEYRRAIDYHEQQLQIARQIRDQVSEASATNNLGLAYYGLGEYRRAIDYLKRRLQIANKMGDRRGSANATSNLGLAYQTLGEYHTAIKHHERALSIYQELGNRLGEGAALGNLGISYGGLGEHHRGIEYLEQVLQIKNQIGDSRGKGQTLGNLGNAYRRLGEPLRAIEYYIKQLQIVQEVGDRLGEAIALFNSAVALDDLGDRAAAIVNAEAALKIFKTIESPRASTVRNLLTKWRGKDKAHGSAK